MEYNITVYTEIENDIKYPTTVEELDALFENKIPTIQVDKHHIILAVDKNSTYRNEDKGAGYFKYYYDCNKISGDMSKVKVYRVNFWEPVYTSHNGIGYTPDHMPMEERKVLVAGLNSTVSIKGEEMKVWDALLRDAKFEDKPELQLTNHDVGQVTKKVTTKDMGSQNIDPQLTKYLDIEYDGKRKK